MSDACQVTDKKKKQKPVTQEDNTFKMDNR